MTVTRMVTWGEALNVEALKVRRGMSAVTETLQREFGAAIGVRNTFAKFFAVTDPAHIKPRDQWRVWIMLAVLGQTPSEWGISDECVPASFEPAALRAHLASLLPRVDSNHQPFD